MAKHVSKAPAATGAKAVGLWIARGAVAVVAFLAVLALTLFLSLNMICGDTSPKARQTFVTTILETGQLKFLASWFLSPEEIQSVVDSNSMEQMNDAVDSDLVDVNSAQTEGEDIEIIKIPGRTFEATLMKVKDPSRISLASIYPWREVGETLDAFVTSNGAIAGINGGLYASTNNTGGRPYGVVVSNGEIQLNEPNRFKGLVLIGFTEDHLLEIISVDGMSPAEVKQLIEEKKIRDAVTFQEESSDANNHFVQLVINGKPRGMNGMGSGLNPRTAIGQCADGSVLMLVTDGRGKSGHLGASASDLIDIMVEHGAVNAANLDGGSSSCMYYEDEYLMTSVTFYYSNDSWKMPVAFIVK